MGAALAAPRRRPLCLSPTLPLASTVTAPALQERYMQARVLLTLATKNNVHNNHKERGHRGDGSEVAASRERGGGEVT